MTESVREIVQIEYPPMVLLQHYQSHRVQVFERWGDVLAADHPRLYALSKKLLPSSAQHRCSIQKISLSVLKKYNSALYICFTASQQVRGKFMTRDRLHGNCVYT